MQSMAQWEGKVKGEIMDQQRKPVASASVALLLAKDSSKEGAGVSISKGVFEIGCSLNGSYILSYSLVGFEKI